jgi:hypothetical protein
VGFLAVVETRREFGIGLQLKYFTILIAKERLRVV